MSPYRVLVDMGSFTAIVHTHIAVDRVTGHRRIHVVRRSSVPDDDECLAYAHSRLGRIDSVSLASYIAVRSNSSKLYEVYNMTDNCKLVDHNGSVAKFYTLEACMRAAFADTERRYGFKAMYQV